MLPMSHADQAPRGLRLELALDAGLTLPDTGDIAVFHPRAGEVLDPLPRERVVVVTPYAPDTAAFSARGYRCATSPEGAFSAAMVCVPRSRDEGRDLLAQASALTTGPVIVDGQKTDGIDALLKALRERTALSEPIAKGHGKIAWIAGGLDLADWRAPTSLTINAENQIYTTQPGVFSADGVDQASALLASALPGGLKGTGADLGAGWGYLSERLLAKAPGIAALHLLEADQRALACARVNVTDPRATFHWVDATIPQPGLLLDFAIMNPPFHTGREAQPQLGAAFIRAAAAMLKPAGQLWMVANRHLPYETTLNEMFRTVTELPGLPGFKLFHAEAPLRQPVATAPKRTRLPRGRKTGR